MLRFKYGAFYERWVGLLGVIYNLLNFGTIVIIKGRRGRIVLVLLWF